MNFGADDFTRELQPHAGQFKKPILAASGVNPAGGQSAQQADKPSRRAEIGNINAKFQTRLRRLCRDLHRAVTINRPHLLAGQFTHGLAPDADDQFLAALADLRARRLHHQHLAVITAGPGRLQCGFLVRGFGGKIQRLQDAVAHGVFRLPGETKLKLSFRLGRFSPF